MSEDKKYVELDGRKVSPQVLQEKKMKAISQGKKIKEIREGVFKTIERIQG
jgi:hypothetical protein